MQIAYSLSMIILNAVHKAVEHGEASVSSFSFVWGANTFLRLGGIIWERNNAVWCRYYRGRFMLHAEKAKLHDPRMQMSWSATAKTAMGVLYAGNAKKEPAATKSPRLAENPLSVTGSAISISELPDIVNRHFPTDLFWKHPKKQINKHKFRRSVFVS